MKLDVLTRDQVQQIRVWRNSELQFLRTPYMITEQMQDEFFDNVINDRESKHRYFAIMQESSVRSLDASGNVYRKGQPYFIGMGGLTNIEWENGTAEISLIINPEYRGKGYGMKAVWLLLEEAFKNMKLYSVYGEVYDCGNKGFWERTIEIIGGYATRLVNRKYYNGTMYDSMWFSYDGINV